MTGVRISYCGDKRDVTDNIDGTNGKVLKKGQRNAPGACSNVSRGHQVPDRRIAFFCTSEKPLAAFVRPHSVSLRKLVSSKLGEPAALQRCPFEPKGPWLRIEVVEINLPAAYLLTLHGSWQSNNRCSDPVMPL